MPQSGEVAPCVGGFGFGGIRGEHFRGEPGGPEGDFIEVTVGGTQVSAFLAVLTLAICFLIAERRKKRFPVLFCIFGVREIRVGVGIEIHGKVISEGVVAEVAVAVAVGMGVALVFRGLVEEGDIKQTGFVSIDERGWFGERCVGGVADMAGAYSKIASSQGV